MLGVLVFVSSFLFFFITTMMIPNVPPGQLICNVFGNSETIYSIADISGELILASVTNGLLWGTITVIFYSYLKGPSKGKSNLPVWLPGYATSHNSKTDNKSTKQRDKPSFQKIRKGQDLESIKGISSIYARRLRRLDINTVDDLLQMASTTSGRNYLAGSISVKASTLLNWVHQAEGRKEHKIP